MMKGIATFLCLWIAYAVLIQLQIIFPNADQLPDYSKLPIIKESAGELLIGDYIDSISESEAYYLPDEQRLIMIGKCRGRLIQCTWTKDSIQIDTLE